MLDHSGTVEDGVNLSGDICKVLCDITINDKDACTEELLIRLLEIVEQHILQSVFCCLLVLASHHTRNGRNLGVDKFAKDMDA